MKNWVCESVNHLLAGEIDEDSGGAAETFASRSRRTKLNAK